MDIITRLLNFWRRPDPVAGKFYQFKSKRGNPWEPAHCQVVEVRPGWVKYRFCDPERMAFGDDQISTAREFWWSYAEAPE